MNSSPLGKALNALTGSSRNAKPRKQRSRGKRRSRRSSGRKSGRSAGSGKTALDKMGGAPINMRGDVKTNDTRLMHLTGSDLFATIPDLSAFAAHEVALDRIITVGDFERLGITSRTFQRVKWAKVVFELIMQTASTTQGGYAMGVIRDPTDVQVSGLDGYRRFIGNQNVQIAKAWENSVVHLPKRTDWLYTSDDTEPRWFSPGKLVVMVDNLIQTENGVPVPASIYAHWSVALKDPTIEDPAVTVEALTANQALQVTDAASLAGFDRITPGPYAVVTGYDQGSITTSASQVFGSLSDETGGYWQFNQPFNVDVVQGSSGGGPATGALYVNDVAMLNTFVTAVWALTDGFSVLNIPATQLADATNKGIDRSDVIPIDLTDDVQPVFSQADGPLRATNNNFNLFLSNVSNQVTSNYNGTKTDVAARIKARDLPTGYTHALGTGVDVSFYTDSSGFLHTNDIQQLNQLFANLADTSIVPISADPGEVAYNLSPDNVTVDAFAFLPTAGNIIFTTTPPKARDVPDGAVLRSETVNGILVLDDVAYCVDAVGRRITRSDQTQSFNRSLVLPKGSILSPWNPDLPDAFQSVGNRVGPPKYKVGPSHKNWSAERMRRALAALTVSLE